MNLCSDISQLPMVVSEDDYTHGIYLGNYVILATERR